MPKIVTLKDNNDDIVYPITPIDAVFTDTSVTLENMIDAKADTDLTNVVNGSVTTNKIANSAVTSDKIDLTTSNVPCTAWVGSSSGATAKTLTKISLGNGLVILTGTYSMNSATTITSDSDVAIRVITENALLSTVYGYSIAAKQQNQTGSYIGYAAAQANTTLIDAWCHCPGTNSNIAFSFIVIGTEAS